MPLLYNYILPTVITTVAIILFVVIFTKKYRNADEAQKLLPIRVIFWMLIATEIFKIFFLISRNGSYDTTRYPVVFCSAVMYTYPLFCFKKNRLSNVAKAYSVIPSFVVFILFVAVQGNYKMSLIQGHSYFYHGAMMAVAIYLLTVRLYVFRLRDFYPLALALSGYVLFCTVLSLCIGGELSIFGPKSSYLGFLYNLFGYVAGNLLLCAAILLLCFGTYGIIHLCTKGKQKKEVSHA